VFYRVTSLSAFANELPPVVGDLYRSIRRKNPSVGRKQLRTIFKFIAWFIGAMIGITASAITIELLTGGHNTFLQGIFGLIGGSIGWMLVGKKSVKNNQE
jgi:hypothetical protein